MLGERVESRQVLVNKSMPTVTNQYTKGSKGSMTAEVVRILMLCQIVHGVSIPSLLSENAAG